MTLLRHLPDPSQNQTGWPWTEEVDPAIYEGADFWPKISIVMPSYNQADFIEEAIRSVLLQNYPDLEFIIFDACSTDGSDGVIRKYGPWLKCWAIEKDRGQSHAINKGLSRSTGKYFNWHNSDDVLSPNSLFQTARALESNPDASYVHGFRRAIFANGDVHSSSMLSYGGPTRFSPDVGTAIANIKAGTQPGCLMNRKLVELVGGINEDLHFVMDTDLLLKLAVLEPPLYLHAWVVDCRYHMGTKSHNAWPANRRYEKLRIIESIFKMPQAQKYRSKRRESMASAHRYCAECAWMNRDLSSFIWHYCIDVLYSPLKGGVGRWGFFAKLKMLRSGNI